MEREKLYPGNHDKGRSLLLACAIILTLSGCSPFKGDSVKAKITRQNVIYHALDTMGPEGCWYNEYKATYMCKDGPGLIDARIKPVREKIEKCLTESSMHDLDMDIAKIIVFDLYYCRDKNGGIPEFGELMYCETELPNKMYSHTYKRPDPTTDKYVFLFAP